MAATTRWVQYDVTASGIISTDNDCVGTRGYAVATESVAAPGDKFTIGPTTNRLFLEIDTVAGYVDLTTGSGLDPRFVAREITELIHDHANAVTNNGWKYATCVWEGGADYGGWYQNGNNNKSNALKIYSGSQGSGSQVVIASGTNTAHSTLGFQQGGSPVGESGGIENTGTDGSPNNFVGGLTVSGTFNGFLDDAYKVVISRGAGATWAEVRGIDTPVIGGSNSYAGTLTTGGVFTHTANETYTIAITTPGTTMGAGSGYVPVMTWTSSPSSDNSDVGGVELLYPDHWYKVGRYGLKVKFSDAVFNACSPAWTIACYKPEYVNATNNYAPASGDGSAALFEWSSDRGDDSASPGTTASGSFVRLGTRGVYIKWVPTGANQLYAGDEFWVVCRAPQPSNYNITSLNYGNVTVSSESPLKVVMFEVIAGAYEISTVKFGLQEKGSFVNHYPDGAQDTMFRFGTVGVDNTAGAAPTNGYEWYSNVVAADIDSDTPPSYLYATNDNLLEVQTADESESIGCWGLMADPIWMNIKLGSSETGANSTINHRLYFDYS